MENAQFENQVPEEDDLTVDEFIGQEVGQETSDFDIPDPNSVVTVRTSTGDVRHVPVSGAISVSELIVSAGLVISGAPEYWLNGSRININDVVPAGSSLTIVGSVKGG